jgi:UDP-3-O-acyl-N-acetylglucosamine deacetylase
MRIGNWLIQVGGAEVPALDGSALPFCDAVEVVGKQEVEKKREILLI